MNSSVISITINTAMHIQQQTLLLLTAILGLRWYIGLLGPRDQISAYTISYAIVQ